MVEARRFIRKARDIDRPQPYITAFLNDFKGYALEEDEAVSFRGTWRAKAFGVSEDTPVDVEIGTGNGYFFAHRANACPERRLVGIELKFKPLILSMKRALGTGATNMRITRNDAIFIGDMFAPAEVNHIFIHHPDPWTKRRKHKRRLMTSEYLKSLWDLQRPGSFIDFKTDSDSYFFWANEQFKNTPYKIIRYTEDLHQSEWAPENFITQFERIFISKGQPIYSLRAEKPLNS